MSEIKRALALLRDGTYREVDIPQALIDRFAEASKGKDGAVIRSRFPEDQDPNFSYCTYVRQLLVYGEDIRTDE